MTKSNNENTKNQTVTCGHCRREIKESEAVWDEDSGELLCPECHAEAENCGCSD